MEVLMAPKALHCSTLERVTPTLLGIFHHLMDDIDTVPSPLFNFSSFAISWHLFHLLMNEASEDEKKAMP
ncbi:uncharacterized protein G2W53_026595 [Senna tora]|uniref:Uncharacterized protein n=1 Tax=Senna tora TaxID=362788 RepID=A0A834THQ9_9FABA|nr:uncharacterized protein G2W53_026595 [Senna tora]